ncbi:DUF397 domain-containing protein [Streptomyces sp. NPDC026206]|uniref:DUF397 domain-containing protein n=1 Tax=Streptomyces sp. NPDC026206 TaxID=3157089 RepID=UPI00340BF2F7
MRTDLNFKKSSYSSGGDNCVEVAVQADPGAVAIRDSKEPEGPILRFRPSDYLGFEQAVRRGEL